MTATASESGLASAPVLLESLRDGASSPQYNLGWTPRLERIGVIVDTAWRWRDAHRHGYRKAKA